MNIAEQHSPGGFAVLAGSDFLQQAWNAIDEAV